ncbi:MAG TPA: S8 family peptidase [Pyrinomonadaceae bacterium]|jgi:subtilisin family serine protease
MVEVLVRLRNQGGDDEASLAALAELGMIMRAKAPGPNTVVSGEIPLRSLPAVEQMASVRRVEASRPLNQELDLCVPEVNAHIPHLSSPAIRGAGSIIGVIDTGIDLRHPHFINPDGTSRILRLWDQGAEALPDSAVYYGREYTRAQINEALRGATPAADCLPTDPDGHGTHVCGIAAGSGRARPTHLGLAPDSDLVVVALNQADSLTPGWSVHAFEAFDYVVKSAAGRPLAINFSQGMNGGGHCGETVLETGLDNFARLPNVAIIKSAGNEQQMRIHAGGVLRTGETREVRMEVRDGNERDDVLELWFADDDEIGVALRPPGDGATRLVGSGAMGVSTTPAGNVVRIEVEADSEQTGDTVTTIIISRGSAPCIQPGTWTLILRAGAIRFGRFDAWIERTVRPGEQMRFAGACHDPTRTISIPGTARNIITVGAYVMGAEAGDVALYGSSGLGPTRYGQCKPELVAPGEVKSARSGTQSTVVRRGTSMAAAVVTGAAALVMSQRDGLTCAQLKQILVRSARTAGPSNGMPDNAWGYGKLDVQAALEVAARARFPKVMDVRVDGTTIYWHTDIATTGGVRLLPNRRQLVLGKSPHRLEDPSPSRSHQVTVEGLPAGKYFFQIVAVSEGGFSSEDDNGGKCYEINVAQRLSERAEALTTSENAVPAETARGNSRLLEEQAL